VCGPLGFVDTRLSASYFTKGASKPYVRSCASRSRSAGSSEPVDVAALAVHIMTDAALRYYLAGRRQFVG
jgi:hypothetical protein